MADFLEDFCIRAVRREDVVEGEGTLAAPDDWRVIGVGVYGISEGRSYAYHDFDGGLQFVHG